MENHLIRQLTSANMFKNAYFLLEPAENVHQTSKTLTFLLKIPKKPFL